MKEYKKCVEYCFQCPNMKKLVIGNPAESMHLPEFLREMTYDYQYFYYCSAINDELIPINPNHKPHEKCPLKDID